MGKPAEKPDRFAVPRASIIANPLGAATLGLPDKLGKRINQHGFEAEIAHRNVVAADAEGAPPNGLRFAASVDYNGRLEESKQAHDDWKRPNKPAFKETLTSISNPLRTAANDPSGLPFYVDRNIPAAQVEEEQGAKGKRCFTRNVNYGMMEQLEAGTLLPLSSTEMKESRQVARHAAATAAATASHGTCKVAVTSPGRKQGLTADVQGHVDSDIEHQEQEEVEGEEEQPEDGVVVVGEDLSSYPTLEDKGGTKKMIMKHASQELAVQRALEDRLALEWPHGAPKHVIMKLAREMGLASGTSSVPTLGFGFPSSLSSKMAAATLRRQ